MRITYALVILSAFAPLPACACERDGAAPAQSPQPPAADAADANPISAFARMVGGEWKMMLAPGMGMYERWEWGPGMHSLRGMTHGEDAAGNAWRELQLLYWHPGRKQVRVMGVGPFERSVWDGTIMLKGDTAEGTADLYQIGTRRTMGLRWTFDGADKYRETLLEDRGAGLEFLAEWDHVRQKTPTAIQPLPSQPAFPVRLQPLQPLAGHTWESRAEVDEKGEDVRTEGSFPHLLSTFERIPYADGIYARVAAPGLSGVSVHLFDVYLYHHTGTGVLRCLALGNDGGVYEGDVAVLDGGGLQAELKGYEGERIVSFVVRLDFQEEDNVRQRVWLAEGETRTLLLDLLHHKREPEKE